MQTHLPCSVRDLLRGDSLIHVPSPAPLRLAGIEFNLIRYSIYNEALYYPNPTVQLNSVSDRVCNKTGLHY